MTSNQSDRVRRSLLMTLIILVWLLCSMRASSLDANTSSLDANDDFNWNCSDFDNDLVDEGYYNNATCESPDSGLCENFCTTCYWCAEFCTTGCDDHQGAICAYTARPPPEFHSRFTSDAVRLSFHHRYSRTSTYIAGKWTIFFSRTMERHRRSRPTGRHHHHHHLPRLSRLRLPPR